MNNTAILQILFLICSITIISCSPTPNDTVLKTKEDTISYYYGLYYGDYLKDTNIDSIIDYRLFKKGVNDALSPETDTNLVSNYATQIYLDMYLEEYRISQLKYKYRDHIAENQAFLEENAKRDSVVSLPNGLQYIILKDGSGDKPSVTDIAVVNFSTYLIDGTLVESSYNNSKPYTFRVNTAIPGWTLILPLMSAGSRWRVYIPSELTFGSEIPDEIGIKPFSTLIYDIELLEINP